MPLIEQPLPSLQTTLHGAHPPSPYYLIFYADVDEAKGEMWCPDCVDVDGTVNKTFSGSDASLGVVIRVGDKPTWKDPKNEYRHKYGIQSIPTIVRFEEGKEVSRLVLDDINDETKRSAFLK